MDLPQSSARELLLAAAWLCAPPLACANPEPSKCDQDIGCRQHLDAALQLDHEQKYEPALAEFRAAYRRHPNGRMALNIGRSLHKLGRFDEALIWYQEAGRAAPAEAALSQELRNFVADAKLAQHARAMPQIVFRPNIQIHAAPVYLRPINNIRIDLMNYLPPGYAPSSQPVDKRQLPRPVWRLVVGTLFLGGGLLTSGFGAAALGQNGHCASASAAFVMPPVCLQTLGTEEVGVGLLTSGLLFTVIGALTMAVPENQ